MPVSNELVSSYGGYVIDMDITGWLKWLSDGTVFEMIG